ncbi:gamma-glutamylcyclotransferase [Cytobacillus sp. NCCP-133]|uniref:gamma-glutamylcyclotransferase n=1 Tax=Cytobacillus sp. NCCP-133 TaxID=766848 RepID=UPI00222EE9F3|nr:gamma-glutamylcyclotransferase family protein [Cytobacillus sp. NCCP-133]GLB60717.1 putative gamma-glutamylcyclotransferase YkqA [Cytobacillus sp. NCCP-133]
MTTQKLFVYGTLRKNESNHFVLKGSPCIAEQAWVYGELYDTGLGYPSMKASLDHKVYGELYEVHLGNYADLDELEDFIPGRKDNLYDRVEQTVHTDTGEVNAFVYVSKRDDLLAEPILHGDWKLYRLMKDKPERTLYFAYGSCMDDERFRLSNVDQHFRSVVGAGVLKGYSMQYLFSRDDGGRADIIENGGVTEGILYELPYAAVEYLFHREGFYGQWYRPAFVNVQVGEDFYPNVLTFHVYNKKGELPPPDHYATEILRGAKGRVSDDYYKKLEGQLEKLGVKINLDAT